MKASLFQIIARTFRQEPKLHPIDCQLAKRWTKERLLIVFPELRGNPAALERAYQSLSLDPKPGTEEGDEGIYFELKSPDPS